MDDFIRLGDIVTLVATDPWDFVSVVSDTPQNGRVVAIDAVSEAAIIVELDKPLMYQGREASLLLAIPRHSGQRFGDLSRGCLFCNITSLNPQAFSGEIPKLPVLSDSELSFLGDIRKASEAA